MSNLTYDLLKDMLNILKANPTMLKDLETSYNDYKRNISKYQHKQAIDINSQDAGSWLPILSIILGVIILILSFIPYICNNKSIIYMYNRFVVTIYSILWLGIFLWILLGAMYLKLEF